MIPTDFTSLTAFVAVAEEKSFTRAAKRQGVSPSAISVASVSSPYDVSGDGERFLVNGFGERGTLPVTVVANWKELLKNK